MRELQSVSSQTGPMIRLPWTVIGVATITQLRTFNGNITYFFISYGTSLKENNSLPAGANFFLKEKYPV